MVIKILHILLHFGTNLAARNNGMTIGGVAGVYITYYGCNRKTPMVELVTINKHCREIARTLTKKKLLNKKSKNMLSVCMHPRVFFVTNHFQDERHTMHEDMRTTPTAHLVPPVGGIYLEIPTSHTWLLVS